MIFLATLLALVFAASGRGENVPPTHVEGLFPFPENDREIVSDDAEAWPSVETITTRFLRDGLFSIVSDRAQTLSAGLDRQLPRLRFSPEIFDREFRRGLNTRDFFRTQAPLDGYNTDRIGISHGPLAFLHGSGSPTGAVHRQSIRANHRREWTRLHTQLNSDGAYRITTDINHPLADRNMGFRVAALAQDGPGFRTPSRNERQSVYGNWQWHIDRRNQLSVSAEWGRLNNIQPASFILYDRYTPWVEAGRPLVDEPRAPVGAINGVEWVSGGNYLVFIEDSTLPVMDWRRMARGATPTLDGQRENRLSFRPETLPGGLSAYHSLTGISNRLRRDYGILAGFWEYVLGGWLSMQIAGQYETGDRHHFQGLRDGDHALQVDVNRFLPDGSPNPNAGRPYLETSSRSLLIEQEWASLQGRFVGSVTLEPHTWHPSLGTYEIGWALTYWRLDSEAQWRHEVNTTPLEGARPNLNHGSNQIRRRHYLDFSGPVQPVFASSFESIQRDGVESAFLPTGNAPRRTSDANTTSLLSLQGKFFNDRLILHHGVGHDRTSLVEHSYKRDDLGLWPAPAQGTREPAHTVSRIRRNTGLSLVPGESVILYYNRAEGFLPTGFSQRDVFDERVPTQEVRGSEYGVFIHSPENRLSANVSAYEMVRANESSGALRGAKGTWVYEIWESLDPERAADRTAWVDLQDTRARGFEMDLVYNPTPNLRLAWNLGREQRTVHDILPRFARYLDTHLPLWQANADAPVNSASGETVGDLTDHILDDFGFERAQIGSRLLYNREWQTRFNLNYRFDRASPLHGWSLGGNARWLERNIIGFASMDNGRLDKSRPFRGDDILQLAAWIGYARRVNEAHWSLRLQVNNLLDDRSPNPNRAADDGSGLPVQTQLATRQPRTFQLTSVLRF